MKKTRRTYRLRLQSITKLGINKNLKKNWLITIYKIDNSALLSTKKVADNGWNGGSDATCMGQDSIRAGETIKSAGAKVWRREKSG